MPVPRIVSGCSPPASRCTSRSPSRRWHSPRPSRAPPPARPSPSSRLDNFCHTLVGAACGEAGLKRRTRYGNVTLMIAANLPDLDVLSFATDTDPISFRRGWTHGIVAQLVLPVALTAAVYAFGRLRRPRGESGPPLRAGWLLLLSSVGVYSHVFLDFLNNYGVRLLAPFDWRWFYGDTLFIADVWLWLALGAGVWLAR